MSLSSVFVSLLLIEGLRERTEPLDIFLFFRPSLLSGVLFPMLCLLVNQACQILVL